VKSNIRFNKNVFFELSHLKNEYDLCVRVWNKQIFGSLDGESTTPVTLEMSP